MFCKRCFDIIIDRGPLPTKVCYFDMVVRRVWWESDALDFFKGTNTSGGFHELACVLISILRQDTGTWNNEGSSLFGSNILLIAPLLQAASRRMTNSKPSLETSVTYLDSPGVSWEVMVVSCSCSAGAPNALRCGCERRRDWRRRRRKFNNWCLAAINHQLTTYLQTTTMKPLFGSMDANHEKAGLIG